MATKIPLNYFRRISTPVTTNDTSVYVAPFQRAGIIISALAANLTDLPQTVTASLSATGNNTVSSSPKIVFLNNFEIPPNDTVNIVINKLVLQETDNFIISAGNDGVVNLTLSVLESVNTA